MTKIEEVELEKLFAGPKFTKNLFRSFAEMSPQPARRSFGAKFIVSTTKHLDIRISFLTARFEHRLELYTEKFFVHFMYEWRSLTAIRTINVNYIQY